VAAQRPQGACTRRCARCLEPFEATRGNQRFCSARCRWKAANDRGRGSVVDPRLAEFFAAVSKRLEQGRITYGDRSFDLPPSDIVAEAQAELLDNAAYSFIAWCRLEQLRLQLARLNREKEPL
jgi:hypothetical protein